MKTMVQPLLNHIQGRNGRRWADFIRKTGAENILLVAVDVAKYSHKAMICTFYGDILVKPFEFDASDTGFSKLREAVQFEKEKQGMKKVVFGIETTGHYYEDLLHNSYIENYYVRIINATTTKEMRKMLLNWSKTDNLDLMAIVHAIIYGHGTSKKLTTNRMDDLQKLTRSRRALVSEQTSIKNQIRVHLDFIFREFQGKIIFQNGKKEKVKPFTDIFGKSGIYFMKNCLHPSDILSLGKKGLRELSIRENLKLRDSTIGCLLEFAQFSISKSKEQVEVEQFLLNLKLEQLDIVNKQIRTLESEIQDLFIQTRGSVILSVPGIGVALGAELVAEMGDISDFSHAGQLIKMAGTNPIVKQSGDRKPSYYAISRQGRRPFRNVVYQVGKSLAFNNPEMNQRYKALIERGKAPRQAYVALGNRMIRLAYSMMKYQTLYRSNDENYTLLNQIDKKLRSKNKKLFFEKIVSSETHSA